MAKKKGVVESAADAAIELGQAAESFKKSWQHVKKARKKGSPAARAATRTGKRMVRAAKKVLPKRISDRKS